MNVSAQLKTLRTKALNREMACSDQHGGVCLERAGEGYLYRPGQILLGRAAVDVLRRETQDPKVQPDEETNARFEERGVDVQRWTVPSGIELPALRVVVQKGVRAAGSHAELNHVFAGEWVYLGGPACEPMAAAEIPLPPGGATSDTVPSLAVLDTGIGAPPHQMFSASLLREDGSDIDLLDEDGDLLLDIEAGHGTFICGLAQRVAPGLSLEQRKVLTSNGFGDDLSVALGIAETRAAVLNLSLGGYTSANRPPRALQAALATLGRDRVVIAAAGNNGGTRSFWPAAFADVIAVGAYDSATGDPAPFSNYGTWVDVCAPGVDLHSCYVDGRRDVASTSPTFAGWAAWSGTSFAAPIVAAEIARRTALSADHDPKRVTTEFLAELGPLPGDGRGRRYAPSVDVRAPMVAESITSVCQQP